MVIDELIVIEDGEQKFVDSADNKVIDVIKYNGGKNLLSLLIKGIILDFTTGAERTHQYYASTDYIPVDLNTNSNYCLSGLVGGLHSCVFAYNSNKEFLGRTAGAQKNQIILNATSFTSGTPQAEGDIAYLRVSQYYVSGTSTNVLDDIDNAQTQLEKGDTATTYEPFGGVDYHFAKENEVTDGVCDNAVAEPIIDMQISGNSVQRNLPEEYTQYTSVTDTNGTVYEISDGVYPAKRNSDGTFGLYNTNTNVFQTEV